MIDLILVGGAGGVVLFTHGSGQPAGLASPVLSSCTNALAAAVGSGNVLEAFDQRGAHDRGISMLGDGLHLAGRAMPNPQAIGRGSFRNSATRASTSGAVSLSPVIPARANKYTKPPARLENAGQT